MVLNEGVLMRYCFLVPAFLIVPAVVWAQVKPISAEEAAKKVGEKVLVEMEVKSTGKTKAGDAVFLNSHTDFKDKSNFTVMLTQKVMAALKEAKVEDLAAHFGGKVIRVSGKVELYKERPEIVINEADQIKIVEKKQ
jgi:DNA/RNA endonuclease YhcR with UshA esterase domain